MVGKLVDFVLVFVSIFILIPSGLSLVVYAWVLRSQYLHAAFALFCMGEVFLVMACVLLWFAIKRARHSKIRRKVTAKPPR